MLAAFHEWIASQTKRLHAERFEDGAYVYDLELLCGCRIRLESGAVVTHVWCADHKPA